MRVDKLQSSFPHSSLLLAGTVDNTKRKIPSPQTQGGFASLQTGNKATEVHLWHSAVHVSEWLVDSAEGGGGGFGPGSMIWTGPAAPCAGGSEQSSVVRLPKHVEVRFDRVCGDRVLVQRVGGHFISGS